MQIIILILNNCINTCLIIKHIHNSLLNLKLNTSLDIRYNTYNTYITMEYVHIITLNHNNHMIYVIHMLYRSK